MQSQEEPYTQVTLEHLRYNNSGIKIDNIRKLNEIARDTIICRRKCTLLRTTRAPTQLRSIECKPFYFSAISQVFPATSHTTSHLHDTYSVYSNSLTCTSNMPIVIITKTDEMQCHNQFQSADFLI